MGKEGRRIPVSVARSRIKDENGSVIAALVMIHDISERKRTQAALRDSELRHRQRVDALPVAVYTTDAQGSITPYNALQRPTTKPPLPCGGERRRSERTSGAARCEFSRLTGARLSWNSPRWH